MKIDGNRPAHGTHATDGTRRAGKDGGVRQGSAASAGASTDRVELSSDAALLAAALKAAHGTADVRTDVVERVREKLNAGTVGNDAARLADAIIDDLVK